MYREEHNPHKNSFHSFKEPNHRRSLLEYTHKVKGGDYIFGTGATLQLHDDTQ